VAADAGAYWRGRAPLDVVLNAVDLTTFRPDGPAADLDALSGLPPAAAGVVRVGLVATMGRFKGHEVFLRALAQLPRHLPVRGYVIGGALYETTGSEWSVPALRALASTLGIADRVGFTGFVESPADAMRALDVVVHASTGPEPFGLVIAEGMACGRAVITSAAGGAGELVDPGVDAVTHAPGNVQALAAAIERLAGDRALRQRLGAAGHARAARDFNHERLAHALIPIYRRTLVARGAAPGAAA
jgi:glycosyltransferase involved in cell wall biosynthesis